jgi:hypothetical protein
MRSYRLALAALIGIALFGTQLRAARVNDPRIRVERAGAARVTVPAGTVSTLGFKLRNLEATRAVVAVSVSLPNGWTLINAAEQVALAPGAADLQLLSFAVPKAAPAGWYTIRYTVRYGAALQTSDSVMVELRPRAELDAQFLAAPALVRGGTSFTVSFVLRNRGNTTIRANLSAHADGGLTARTDFTQVVIEPEQLFHVAVRVTSPTRLPNEIHTRIRLLAIDRAQDLEVSGMSTLVRVLPTVNRVDDPSGYFPLRLYGRVNRTNTTRPAFELSGGGPLIAGSDLRLEVMAKSANGLSGLTEDRDQYFVRLGNSHFDAQLGDHVAALTPLTETGRLGFGASMNLNAGPVILGAIALRDRHADNRDMWGGRFGFKLGSFGSITGNYLSRNDDAKVMSVRTLLAPAQFLRADAEFARNAGGNGIDARSVNIGGRLSWISYDVRSIRNAPDYRGTYLGTARDAAVVRVRPIGKLELGASYLYSQQNSERFGLKGSVESYRAFASLGGIIGVDAEQREWFVGDSQEPNQTQAVRVRSTLKTGPLTWYPVIERTDSAFKYAMRARLNVGQQSINASFGAAATEHPEDSWSSMSVSMSLRPASGTRFNADYQKDYYGAWQTSLLTAGFEQQLPGGHAIAARARYVRFNGALLQEQSGVTLEYMVPLNVPISHAQRTQVDGVLVDVQTNRPIKNGIVRLDDRTVVTGSNGRFSFRNVRSGTHYLQFDMSSVGANLTTTTQNPLIVDLSDGRSKDLSIPITRAAQFHGVVKLHGGEADSTRITAFRNTMIIELSQGSDIHRRSLDRSGKFAFENMRPGTWRMRVVNDLPLDYALNDAAGRSIELSAGETRTVELELVRKQRPVQLIEEKEIKSIDQR